MELGTYRCLAHSNPRPELAPVTITVFPVKSTLGSRGVWKSWPRTNWEISDGASLLVVCCWEVSVLQDGLRLDEGDIVVCCVFVVVFRSNV
jgi:hypothetical protein